MKIYYRNGRVNAQAESMEDIKTLLALKSDTTAPKRESTWKGKHRVPCEICGKMCKNIKLHILRKHQLTPITPNV